MATGDTFDQFEMLLIEQVDDEAIHRLDLDEDDIAWALIQSVKATTKAGKNTDSTAVAGFEASWRIRVQRGGAIAGGKFGESTLVKQGPGDSLIMGQSQTAKYLDPAYTPSRSYKKIKMDLKRMKGQLTVNLDQILAEMATDPLDDLVMDSVEDAVALVRSMFTTMFWHQGEGIVALVNDSGPSAISESSPTAVTIDAGKCYRFIVGQRYVASALSGGALSGGTRRGGKINTPGVFRCVAIDTENLLPHFQAEIGEGSIVISDNDAIVALGMYDFVNNKSLAPQSVETLFINTGTYPGTAFDVTVHLELKALVEDNTASMIQPTSQAIGKIIDLITEPGKRPPNVLAAESSVWSQWGFLEKDANALYTVPMGGAFVASGGVAGPTITHGEFTFGRLQSAKCRENAIHGLPTDTFKRFVPLGETIKWRHTRGGNAGVSGIFHEVYDGRQLTEQLAADFDFFIELGQTDPRRGFRQLGVHSQRTS